MNRLVSKVLLNVNGKNINRFIKKLRSNKIDILSLKYKNSNEANIIILKKDYEKILKIKSIYEITELDVFGLIKIKRKIMLLRHVIIVLLFAFCLFMLLTNMIFNIEVIHSNKSIRLLIINELKNNGIKKYSFKKNYNEINKIKEKILNKYQDKIEWLEIENSGTKYIVRVVERNIKNDINNNIPRNIIAKKSGVIRKVVAKNGDIVKDMNDFVNKGDLIINGELIFNNKVTGKVRSEGSVYAEVWYTVKCNYPIAYYNEILTGKKKTVYGFKFLNHYFEFSFNKFKYKNVKEQVILKHSLIPFKLVKQEQDEIKLVNQVLTYEQAINKAKGESVKKIKSRLKNDEYIIKSKYLKSSVNESTIEVEMFFSVYEDITDYQEIG